MKHIPEFFTTSLLRHPKYTAHIRTKDFAVLFTPLTNTIKSEQLFLKQDNIIGKQQIYNSSSIHKKTFTMYLVLCDQCNLQCLYCDVLGKKDHRKNKGYMTWDIAKIAINELLRRIKDDPELNAQIVFFGGEPLLNWSLLTRICKEIKKTGLNNKIEKMLVTNGILLNRKKAVFLKKHNVYVVVSIDGQQKTNDSVRCYYNGTGSFADISKGLKCLMNIMPEQYGISCTLGSHNALSLSKEIVYLHEKFDPCCIGINVFHFQQDGTCPIKIDDKTLCKSLLSSFKIARKKGIAIYQFANILKAFTSHQRNKDYCPACVNKLLFSPNGRVGRCETLMSDKRFSVSLQDFLTKPMPKELDWSKYTPEHEPICLKCIARWICPGSCAYDQFISTGSLNGVEPRRCNFHIQFLIELLSLVLDSMLKQDSTQEIYVPLKHDFAGVMGNIPTSFPDHTIFVTGMGSMSD